MITNLSSCKSILAAKRPLAGFLVALLGATTLSSCGRHSKHSSQDESSEEAISTETSNETHENLDPNLPVIMRAKWEIQVSSDKRPAAALAGTSSYQTISGQVAASVTFTLSNANFATPEAVGFASYGSLDIIELRDNALRICGDGHQKCMRGLIRVYTTGTPQPGLWNETEQVGLPISSGGTIIGLESSQAYTAASVSIGTKGTLKLADFTSSAALSIPIGVDFTDAPAGSYGSTLVIEYVLQ